MVFFWGYNFCCRCRFWSILYGFEADRKTNAGVYLKVVSRQWSVVRPEILLFWASIRVQKILNKIHYNMALHCLSSIN